MEGRYILSIARSRTLDLSIEALPGNRLLAMRCPDPAHSTRLCFDYLELGYRWPGDDVDTERVTGVDLYRASQAPSLGISLAMRRCAFPVCDIHCPWDVETRHPAPAPQQQCWVGGIWCSEHERHQPAAALLWERVYSRHGFEADSVPLVLSNDDLAWWLDAHLVERAKLLALLKRRRCR